MLIRLRSIQEIHESVSTADSRTDYLTDSCLHSQELCETVIAFE